MDDRRSLEARRLVETYADTILRLCYTYLHSMADAEDLWQNVLLKLMEQKKPFDSETHEKAWVIRTAINECKSEMRAARRKLLPLEEFSEAAAPSSQHSEILDAVMRLPEKYRIAVYLFYYEGYGIREIAKITKSSESAIAKQLSRGRKTLREQLGDDEHETRR